MTTVHTKFDFNNSGNGYTYQKDTMKKALDDYINRVNSGNQDGILGEVSHGSESKSEFISLGSVSHKVKSIKNNDGTVDICAEILDTPMGKVVQNMMGTGQTFNFTSKPGLRLAPRMLATPEEEVDEEGNKTGTYHMNIDKIICWDIVEQKL